MEVTLVATAGVGAVRVGFFFFFFWKAVKTEFKDGNHKKVKPFFFF